MATGEERIIAAMAGEYERHTAEKASAEFTQWVAEMVDVLLDLARTVIPDHEFYPTFLSQSPQGKLAVIPLIDDGKPATPEQAYELLVRFSSAPEFQRGSMIVQEAWSLVETDKDRGKFAGSLEHVPGRTETLMFNAMLGGMQILTFIPIVSEDGKRRLDETKRRTFAPYVEAVTGTTVYSDDNHGVPH